MPEAAKKQDEGKSLEDLIAEHLPQKESKHRLEASQIVIPPLDLLVFSCIELCGNNIIRAKLPLVEIVHTQNIQVEMF